MSDTGTGRRRCFNTLRLADTAAGLGGIPIQCRRLDGHQSPHAGTTDYGLSLRWWKEAGW